MSLSHQKFRELVFQLLYSYDLGHADELAMQELMMAQLEVSKKNVRLAQEKVKKIIDHLPQIDPLITSVSTSYSFERIQTVTKNILRLGVFELFFESQTAPLPSKIVISEAIRLSRKFNSPESASFVNALLDQLYQASLGEKINNDELESHAQTLLESEKIALDALEDHLKQTINKAQEEEDESANL